MKKIFILAPIIAIPLNVISCSNNENKSEASNNLLLVANAIQNGKVKIKLDIDFVEQNVDKKVKIDFFENEKKYKINAINLVLGDSKENTENEEINKALKSTSIKYLNYLLPIENKDANSLFMLELSNGSSKKNIELTFENICSQNGLKIDPEKAEEIKDLISEKILNIESIVSNLSFTIQNYYEKKNIYDKDDKSFIVDDAIIENIKRVILNSSPYFNDNIYEYKNLFVKSKDEKIKVTEEELENIASGNFEILIWTSEFEKTNPNIYKLSIPFNCLIKK